LTRDHGEGGGGPFPVVEAGDGCPLVQCWFAIRIQPVRRTGDLGTQMVCDLRDQPGQGAGVIGLDGGRLGRPGEGHQQQSEGADALGPGVADPIAVGGRQEQLDMLVNAARDQSMARVRIVEEGLPARHRLRVGGPRGGLLLRCGRTRRAGTDPACQGVEVLTIERG